MCSIRTLLTLPLLPQRQQLRSMLWLLLRLLQCL
jgi:hypothetical protein